MINLLSKTHDFIKMINLLDTIYDLIFLYYEYLLIFLIYSLYISYIHILYIYTGISYTYICIYIYIYIYVLNLFHIFSFVWFVIYSVNSRSGHDRSQTSGPILHASVPKLTFWGNLQMILHGFVWRSSKNEVLKSKTIKYKEFNKIINKSKKEKKNIYIYI